MNGRSGPFDFWHSQGPLDLTSTVWVFLNVSLQLWLLLDPAMTSGRSASLLNTLTYINIDICMTVGHQRKEKKEKGNTRSRINIMEGSGSEWGNE